MRVNYKQEWKHVTLTPRELEILNQLCSGITNIQIGKALFIAPQTVKYHLTSIYRKMSVDSRIEAIVKAWKSGLIPFDVEVLPIDPEVIINGVRYEREK